jgi:Ethylbenzene dehydrogenase
MNLPFRKFRTLVTIMIIMAAILYFPNCTNDNQIIEPASSLVSGRDLLSAKITTAPTIDGVVDPMWANIPKLEFSTSVPEVTGDVFRGYTGNIIPSVTMRSAYDDANIYFLAEWVDPTKSLSRSPWYFDPSTKKWAQESGTFVFGATGGVTRLPFYEDKMAILWNINNSVNGWNSATCFKSCHTGLPAADGASRHFTNFATEKIDMWHWKSVRGGVNAGNQIHDQYQNNAYPNGRKSDAGVDVYQNNSQTLAITGSSPEIKVSVPKYVVPGRTDNHGWILNSEFTAGSAKLVTAVSETGTLTLNDGTTIDPNVDTGYLRVGANVGAKAIAGVTLNDAYTGSMGDIACKAVWANGVWTIEFKRALKTTDTDNDIDFTSLQDQYFGFAIFENAQIAHSIKANLKLIFDK